MRSSWTISHWVPLLLLLFVGLVLLQPADDAEGALDAVQLWNEDFSDEAKVVRDGAVVGITATDMTTVGGSKNATVSDPTNPGDSINVTLYDDGTHGDATANDGIFTGNFTVGDDGGTSGSSTDEASGVIDIAEGDAVSVYVDLDGDGSYSSVTVRTDYSGPGMTTPFEGGYVSGDLIITITIIVEGEAELDPGSVVYSIDSGPSVPFVMIAPNTWQAVIDTTLLADGPHTVTTLSADEAGNVGTDSFEIIVDNTVPDIDYGMTTILPNGVVEVPVSVDDLHLDHSTIRWRWDGGEWQYPSTTGTPANFTMYIMYDDLTPGNHSFEVTAKDLANNSMTYILRFNLPEQSYAHIDLEPPVIEDEGYMPGETVPVNTTIDNDGEVPADVRVDLVVDGEVVDTTTVRVDGNSSRFIELEWPDVTGGEHDVKMVVTMPNATTGDDPVDTIPVKNPRGGSIDIGFPDLTLGRPVTIPTDDLKRGDGVTIIPKVTNPGAVRRYFRATLRVDGVEIDHYDGFLDGGESEDAFLNWQDYSRGKHDVVVELYMDVEYPEGGPVDTVEVTSEDGGPVIVPEPEDRNWIEGPLGILNPLYDFQPFSNVPEKYRPWFLPLLLVGILLGIGLIGVGRRRRKRDEPDMPDTELKAVEMPPVTSPPYPATSTDTVPLTTADTTDTEGTVVRPPDEPPGTTPPPVVPPIASTTGEDGKGEPCVEIIRSVTRERQDVSDAQAAVSDARKKKREAQDAESRADWDVREAEEAARKAKKDCIEAREEYEGYGVEKAEREAQAAKDRIKHLEDQMREMEGQKPEIDGVSWEPKPGYTHGGVGFGGMLSASHVYYRDDQAEIDLNRELRSRYKKYKELKKDLEQAEEDAETEQKEAEELAERAEPAKKRMDEACEKARKAKEEAKRRQGAAEEAHKVTLAAGADVSAAANKMKAEEAEADAVEERAEDCQDCLAKVRRKLAEIERLKRRYEDLKGGSELKGPKKGHSSLDARAAWDEYWDSFRTLRDHSKALSEIKGFTDADLPDEFNGIFDWGGPVGTAVGYGAEDLVSAPVPTDSIKAVGGLYTILQAKLDPDMKEGATALHSHLESKEADEAARAFKRFPRALSNGVKGFERLYRLRDLDLEIGEALEEWEDCLGRLPQAPETPEVDFDKLCYKQCLDKLKELEEAERRMRELVDRAEGCEPSGLDGKLREAKKLKGQLDRMGDAMDRTSRGLANYRKAMKASSGCYISTAAYGSPLAPELDTLRGFRDRVLLPTGPGRLLVDHYRRTAPAIAERLEDSERGRETVRGTVGLAVRIVRAREGRGPFSGTLLSLSTLVVYVIGSLQAWLLTRR